MITFTRKGRYRLSRDGTFISEHNVPEEAYENAVDHAVDMGAGTYRIDPPWTEVDVPILNIIAGSRAGGTQSGGGGGAGGAYAATHYVAPFASVAGASNDYDDLGATSWTNAASSGTPTTLGTACARAVAGNKVQCAAGTYSGLISGTRFQPVFAPSNSGTFGNPIVFFAENPAALNYGSTSLYSKLTHNGVNNNTRAAMGSNNKNYVIFDGFYALYSEAYPAPSEGIFLALGGTGIEFRRIATDSDIAAAGSGYNPQAVFAQASNDFRVYNSRFAGNPDTHRNDAQIQTYGCVGVTIENCYHDCDADSWAIYIKGTIPSTSTLNENVVIRFNRLLDGGIAVGCTTNADVYQNLVTGQPAAAFQYESSGDGYELVRVYNNTTEITSGATAQHCVMRGSASVTGGQNELYNNIFVGPSGNNNFLANAGELAAAEILRWSVLDNNCYYAGAGSGRFALPGTNYTGIVDWRAALAAEGMVAGARDTNSIVSDPLFVGGGDYRLQGGTPASGLGCYITGSETIGLVV